MNTELKKRGFADLTNRNSALDIVRIVAVFSVISIHFLLYTDFYALTVDNSVPMAIVCVIRGLFSVCVPLFMILTGYLMNKKTLSVKYYSGIRRTLTVYLLASAFCMAYRILFLNSALTLKTCITSIFDFSGAPYAWYIEMYIGLFLLIPFLNVMYHGLKTKKQKQALVLTLAVLAVLPSLLNIWNISSFGWWGAPSASAEYAKLIPSWWTGIYPIAYYFVGCYLCEYGLKIKTKTALLLFIVLTLLFGAFNFYRSFGSKFVSGAYVMWSGFEPYVLSILLFVLLSRIKCENWPRGVKAALKLVSDSALAMYLVSFVFDSAVYTALCKAIPHVPSRLAYWLVTVPLIFVCSFVSAFLLNLLASLILKGIDRIPETLRRMRQAKVLNVQNTAFILLFAAALALALWKVPYGFGGNDEAFYLSVPHRLIKGDALFVDEWNLSQMSGVLMTPFVWIYTALTGKTVGMILAARYFYLFVHAAVSVFIYHKLKNCGAAGVIAPLLWLLFTPYNIMAYSYNTMALDLFIVASLLLSTSYHTKTAPFAAAGVLYAAAVLCSPYFAAAYAVFGLGVLVHMLLIRRGHYGTVLSNDAFSPKVFLKFSAGAAGAAVLFLLFVLSRASVHDIIANLPLMLNDPEHGMISVGAKLWQCLIGMYRCRPLFKYALIAYGLQIVALAADLDRKNHRAAHFAVSCLITAFSLALFIPDLIDSGYNQIQFPMVFAGLTAYILLDNKPKRLFGFVFVGGILFAFCTALGSNQYFYIISSAFSVVTLASVVFAGMLIKEMKRRPDELSYGKLLRGAASGAFALAVGLLAVLMINVKMYHCFWDVSPSKMTAAITEGPAAGIRTTEQGAQKYRAEYASIAAHCRSGGKRLLMLTDNTWCYFAADGYDYAVYSAWLGKPSSARERLMQYYAINPEKTPQVIYIQAGSEWDDDSILRAAREAGYAMTRDTSCALFTKN